MPWNRSQFGLLLRLRRCSHLRIRMPAIIPGSALGLNGAVAPSNRIVIGGIGLGPRGRIILKHFLDRPDVQFIAICDPQAERSEIIRRTVNRHYENEDCTAHREMDAVIKHPGIDAVVIATGERWHAPASIRAARAGKDIYCEKPCTMSIDESRELEEAVTANNRIFQAGTQRRNLPNFALACQLAREGKLGKLNTHSITRATGSASAVAQSASRAKTHGSKQAIAAKSLPAATTSLVPLRPALSPAPVPKSMSISFSIV